MSLLFYFKLHYWAGGPNPPDPDAKKKKKEEDELQLIFNQRKTKQDRAARKAKRQKEEDLLFMLGEFN